MKYHKRNTFLLFAAMLFIGAINIKAVNSHPQPITLSFHPAITDSIEWTFTPFQVNPQYGSSRQITPADYSLNFSSAKIEAYLPYYGRAYGGADVFAERSPLYFSSTDFTLQTNDGKKGSKEVSVKFKDQREISNMYFTIFPNGSATLNVNMTNRSPISFIGKVEMLK